MRVRMNFLHNKSFQFGCVLIIFLAACNVMATPTPGAPTGTPVTTPGATPNKKSIGNGFDLPVTIPIWGGNKNSPPTGMEEDGDNPDDTPPPVIYGEELESETDTIFYVLDMSCSMGWGSLPYTNLDGATMSGPRWDRAIVELARSISGLSENFEFNIILYDCSTSQWQPEMQEANETNKQAALGWVHTYAPGGATGTGPSVSQALADKENDLVVLLTDGAPNCGAYGTNGHRTMISSNNTQAATINVFGIAASGQYRAFCQQVAADSGGSYFDVP